jgi:hypothetical protein
MSQASQSAESPARPTLLDYAVVCSILVAATLIAVHTFDPAAQSVPAATLVPPLFAMLALTAIVWLMMALLRNLMVSLGKASMRYYRRYADEVPAEWIERPARAFNNLMQLPLVFYSVCLVSMTLDRVDASQLRLAWLFVALRAVHALIMLVWNFVPYRFAAYTASSIVLATLAIQIARRCWPTG